MAPGIKGSSATRYQLGAVRKDTMPKMSTKPKTMPKTLGRGGKRGC